MLENGCKLADIIRDTDISQSSIYRLRQEALKRGYDKDVNRKPLLSYVADALRSGRPVKATEEVVEQVISIVITNSTTRELSAQLFPISSLPCFESLAEQCTAFLGLVAISL
jgi:hypothetical protein